MSQNDNSNTAFDFGPVSHYDKFTDPSNIKGLGSRVEDTEKEVLCREGLLEIKREKNLKCMKNRIIYSYKIIIWKLIHSRQRENNNGIQEWLKVNLKLVYVVSEIN